jgi:hypothetical protein
MRIMEMARRLVFVAATMVCDLYPRMHMEGGFILVLVIRALRSE